MRLLQYPHGNQEHSLVSSLDLIRYVYYFQYNMCYTESDLHCGWFGVWDQDYQEHIMTSFIMHSCRNHGVLSVVLTESFQCQVEQG